MEFDKFKAVERMAMMGMSQKEIAHICGITTAALIKLIKKYYGLTWTAFKQKHMSAAKYNLRAKLYHAALDVDFRGDPNTKLLELAVKSMGQIMELEKEKELELKERQIILLEDIEKENEEIFKDEIIEQLLALDGVKDD